MSDQFGPAADDEGTGDVPPPPPPPPPQSAIEPTLTLDTDAEVTKSSGIGGRAVAGIVGALLLVGGTVFAVTQLGASGPASAEDAVAELLDAASDEDVLGLMAALDPGERDALKGPIEDLFGEFERLEVLDDSFELDGVAGFDFEFTDVTYRTEPVRDGLARVYLTGGSVTSGIDTDEIPIGSFVVDTVERFGGEIPGFQESETSDIADGDVFLVAREGSDGWRVSIGYTIAELARDDSGQPVPTDGIEAIGADSPEAAVEAMAQAATQLDVRGVLARLSPGEFAALQEYAPMFLGPAEAEIDALDGEFEISIDTLELSSDRSGDRASVFVDGFAFTATADGLSLAVSYVDGCLDVSGDAMEEAFGFSEDDSPFADGPLCGDDLEELSTGQFDMGEMGFGFEDGENPFADLGLDDLETPELGITTQRVDGEWFVAPLATGLDALVGGLEVLERSHLDAMVDLAEQFTSSFTSSFEEFESVGEAIEPGGFEEFPTTTFTPGEAPTGEIDFVALEALVTSYAGDEQSAACMLDELTAAADDAVLAELAESYRFDYEPSIEAQEAFFAASDACL